jgi:hypothetical protein
MNETIKGFSSPEEHRRFVRYIEAQVSSGTVEEFPADPDYGPGQIYGGRWFRNNRTAEVWRLVDPDFPFKGVWEPVERPQ